MALSKENTHTHPSTSWEDEEHMRAGSGPFGTPHDHAYDRSNSLRSEQGNERGRRPRRRDLMAGSCPRPIVPKSLSEAYRIAQAVCAAKMAPKGLDTPEACMIAIMHGLEVGLSPLSALQRIAVINGRPTIWGDGALALVKASGLCEAIEEWIEGDDPQSWIAVCNLIRKHDPVPVERRFSTEDAKRAKLWGKSGPWSDYPKRMLQMRARAFALRDAFPDVLGGLYLTEEFLAEPETEAQSGTRFETAAPSLAEARVERVEENQPQPSNGFTRAPFNNTSIDQAFSQRDNRPQNVSFKSTQAWNGKATTGDEYTDALNEQPSPQTATTLIGLDGIPNAPLEEIANASATTAITAERALPSTAGLPPLANLRRSRSMPRHIRALRFRNQWSVRQPKGPKQNPTYGMSISDHEARSDSLDQERPNETEVAKRSFRAPSDSCYSRSSEGATQSERFIPPDDCAAHLDLYDAALCCATDEQSLIEIAEEFAERLSQLPRSSRNDAELIFKKHQTRISALESKATEDSLPRTSDQGALKPG